jgi:transglycosylase-like protein
MNSVPVLVSLNTRLLAIAIAALGLLAIGGSALIGEASASSGGIGTGGTGGTGASPTGDLKPQRNERVGVKYTRMWDHFSPADKRWARRTSECESGGNPDAIGGGGLYRGAFQFMRSTWKASPKSPGGDPIAYPYRTQAVVAILLKNRDGADHWPVCG